MDLANLAIKVTTQGVESARSDLNSLSAAGKKTEGAFSGLTNVTGLLSRAAGLLGVAIAGVKLGSLIKDSALLAARYETLGVVMRVAANNAGYYNAQAVAVQASLQKQGISAIASRNAIIQLATANLDLAKATELGRAAQDLAVVAGINSNEAYTRMIQGIKSGEVEILKTMGLNVNFQASYEKLAATLGKHAGDLSNTEKAQARMNAVLQASTAYAGIYEEAMGTAGKQVTSLSGRWEDLKLTLGEPFLPIVTALVEGMMTAVKETTKALQEMGRAEFLQGIGIRITQMFKTAWLAATVLVYMVGQVIRIFGVLAGVTDKLVHGDLAGASAAIKSFSVDYKAASDSMLISGAKQVKSIMSVGQAKAETSKADEEARIAAGRRSQAQQDAEDVMAKAAKDREAADKKAARESASRAKAAARDYQQLVDKSDDYIKSLRKEVDAIGQTEQQTRALNIARAMADAPLEKQKQIIANLSLERERAISTAQAWDRLNELRGNNADATMSPLQKLRKSNAIAINDSRALDGPGVTSIQTQMLEEAANQAERLARAQEMSNVQIVTMAERLGDLPAGIGQYKTVTDRVLTLNDAIDNLSGSFGQLYDGVKNRDWVQAGAGLVNSITNIRGLYDQGKALSGTKAGGVMMAGAGIADIVGQAVGGKAGSTLSGAASGAMAGFTLSGGNPIAAVIGAVIGAVAGNLGASKADKQAKAQAEMQAAQAAAQKAAQIANQRNQMEVQLLELQGRKTEALALARKHENDALDSSLKELKAKLDAQQDYDELRLASLAAEAHYLELTGETMKATNLLRAEELRNMKESLRPLQIAINAADDARTVLDSAWQTLQGLLSEKLAAAQERVSSARDKLSAAYERESGALQSTIDKFRDFAKNLREFRDSLTSGPDALLSPEDAYKASKAKFEDVYRRAKMNDPEAVGQLANAGSSFLEASRSYNASSGAYFGDRDAVAKAVDEIIKGADRTADNAQQQLDALNELVSGYLTLNGSTLSVTEAIKELATAEQEALYWQDEITRHTEQINALLGVKAAVLTIPQAIDALGSAMAGYSSALANLASVIQTTNTTNANPTTGDTSTPVSAGYTSTGGDYAAYVKANPDLASLWSAGTGMAANHTIEEFGLLHWSRYGQNEDRPVRPYAKGGVVDRPTHLPLAGEAGPEGILPLRRNSRGELGVSSSNDGEAMRQMVTELRASNQLGVALAKETINRLDALIETGEKQERAMRAAGAR